MPSPPRILLPGSVVFITTRMQEGLPLIPVEYMRVIVEGILGRAQKLYRVKPCHYTFMSNHFHMMLVVEDPDTVAGFMDRVKTEIAHAVNRLLGRRQRSVWCDGYDATPILTKEDCIEKIAYIYTNPQKAGLVEKIEEYPGISSWGMYMGGKRGFAARWINRSLISKLSKTRMSEEEQKRLARMLIRQAKRRVVFRVYTDAWMDSFEIEEGSRLEINQEIIDRVRELESEHSAERLLRGSKVLGAEALRRQPIDKPYSPKSFGRRMWCICRDVAVRVSFIQEIKELLRKAREVKARWSLGDFSVSYPLGLFPPRMARLGNLVPNALL